MKKTIGMIDYFLYEWHANNYPAMFKELSDEFEIKYAWGKIDYPGDDGMSNKEWGEKYGVCVTETIEEVIEKSDYLIVLSPDNPEMHEELCKLPLQSGKNTYIDKTFAPTKKSAERIFCMAEKGNTKCYSSSALYFADEYQGYYNGDVKVVDSCGGGVIDIYIIHQLEPICAMMKSKPLRAISVGTEEAPLIIIEFENEKTANISIMPALPFAVNLMREGKSEAEHITVSSDFFKPFIKSMADFFKTGAEPVSHEQTLNVIAAREAALEAVKNPFKWIDINM